MTLWKGEVFVKQDISSTRKERLVNFSSLNKNLCSSRDTIKRVKGFPGGTVVKNPPANAGDTGLSPGPGRSHMPWSN